MKVLLIDNYDSFTYNLYQYVGEILNDLSQPFELKVIRNDEQTLPEIQAAGYDRIIISPGPGDPSDQKYFGVCAEVILELGKTTPVLGVCLGMQGICHYFGGKVVRAKLPMHGKTSKIQHDGQGVFQNLPQNIEVMRYHSLVADPKSLPPELQITAWIGDLNDPQNLEIMGLRHKHFPIQGIQFHPESFATEGGMQLLRNFINS